jgi:hypothetical protein
MQLPALFGLLVVLCGSLSPADGHSSAALGVEPWPADEPVYNELCCRQAYVDPQVNQCDTPCLSLDGLRCGGTGEFSIVAATCQEYRPNSHCAPSGTAPYTIKPWLCVMTTSQCEPGEGRCTKLPQASGSYVVQVAVCSGTTCPD